LPGVPPGVADTSTDVPALRSTTNTSVRAAVVDPLRQSAVNETTVVDTDGSRLRTWSMPDGEEATASDAGDAAPGDDHRRRIDDGDRSERLRCVVGDDDAAVGQTEGSSPSPGRDGRPPGPADAPSCRRPVADEHVDRVVRVAGTRSGARDAKAT
jgi:hypothetical protein